LAFIAVTAVASFTDSLIFWLTCWLPNYYCPHANTEVHLGGALSMLGEFLHDFLTFKYASYVLMVFAPLVAVIFAVRHLLESLPRQKRWFWLVVLGSVVGIAFEVGGRGYASNWEVFLPIWEFMTSGVISAVVASCLVWWAARPCTWSNYAMQRSSHVGTPLAGRGPDEDGLGSASGAPTTRRR
jgi:4-amino-4-deoxy-L-arabinose transferase-like glycosyltransferase